VSSQFGVTSLGAEPVGPPQLELFSR